jgi:hypothetical protein
VAGDLWLISRPFSSECAPMHLSAAATGVFARNPRAKIR